MRNLSKGFLSAAAAFAIATPAFADFTYPVLVLDSPNTASLPNSFRASNSPLASNNNHVSIQGLSTTLMMGSAQFSEKQLSQVIAKYHPATLMLIDLRQEDHGFLNGDAISWFGIANRANAGKTGPQIEQDQYQRLADLQTTPQITIQQVTQLSPDGKIVTANPITVTYQTAYAESDLARAYNFGYTRFYITAGQKPSMDQIDHFVSVVQPLPVQTWLYFHASNDQERTTTFMAMFDMMRNAKNVSFNDIISRQVLLGGADLSQLPVSSDPSFQDRSDRYNFLKQFYAYCVANKDGFKTLFSSWTKQQALDASLKKTKTTTTTTQTTTSGTTVPTTPGTVQTTATTTTATTTPTASTTTVTPTTSSGATTITPSTTTTVTPAVTTTTPVVTTTTPAVTTVTPTSTSTTTVTPNATTTVTTPATNVAPVTTPTPSVTSSSTTTTTTTSGFPE